MANLPLSDSGALAVKTARTAVGTRVLDGFDDPGFGVEQWEKLLSESDADIVYLTWHWQRSWWETFGKGQLLLIVADREGVDVALAPLYCRSGMVYFIGAAHWQAYRLDFIGDIREPEVLDAILATARDQAFEFRGFKFEYLPGASGSVELLKAAANRLKLSCYEEWKLESSTIDLAHSPEVALEPTNRRRLRKRESFLRQRGKLEVHHEREGDAIAKHLEELFEMHVARWSETSHSSLFTRPEQRQFYERLTTLAASTGWLRFTRVAWDDRPIAFHYGFCYKGRYFWNVSTFAVDLARRSPGQILLRHLLLAAVDEGADVFDFGSGDQLFKLRCATDIPYVYGMGLYLSKRLGSLAST